MSKILRSLAGAATLALSLMVMGCGEPPVLDKPVAQLAQADLEGAVTKLGYKLSGTTSNNGKQVSNVMVSGTKKGADEKPVTLTVSLFTVSAEAKARELERLQKDGAVKADGDKLLAVRVHPKDAADPAAILKQLVGE